jgi:hypothetical protein
VKINTCNAKRCVKLGNTLYMKPRDITKEIKRANDHITSSITSLMAIEITEIVIKCENS